MKASILSAGLATLFAATTLQAQVNLSTANVGDWSVCRTVFPNDACGDADFVPAVAIPDANQPSDWAEGPWINLSGGLSSGNAGGGENPEWIFTFRTSFVLNGVGPSFGTTVSADLFLLDNYLFDGGFFLNGNALTGINWTGAVSPAAPEGTNWKTTFAFTDGQGFINDGVNTLDIKISGNGQTDGMAFIGTVALPQGGNVVPEPTSLALLGFGLTGLGVIARRRRVA